MLSGLEVDVDRMCQKTQLTHRIIMAEAVMMTIAPILGRQEAHEVIYEACRDAIESKSEPKAELLMHEGLAHQLDADRIAGLCEPAGYLGSARAMTRQVVDGPAR